MKESHFGQTGAKRVSNVATAEFGGDVEVGAGKAAFPDSDSDSFFPIFRNIFG